MSSDVTPTHSGAVASSTPWLSGLGVLGTVEERGLALFDHLVARGRRVESRQFQALDRAVCRAAEGAEKWSGEVREKVNHGVEAVLHRANLPTRGDLADLTARLDRLSERIEHLAGDPR